MYTCAIGLSKDCFGTNIGYRGICRNCYKKLVEEGLIQQGDKFEDFPFWLQEMIRFEAASDMSETRHPLEDSSEIEENGIVSNNKGIKTAQMPTSV